MTLSRSPSRRQFNAAAAAALAAGLGGCAASKPVAPPGQPSRSATSESMVGSRASGGAGASSPQTSRLRLAIGSCADQRQPQPIWDTVRAARPDLVIFGGDNVYASEQPFRIEALRTAYDMLEAKPDFRALRDGVPHFPIWDDHDYGLNDGGAGWPHAQAAKDEFLRFWRVPADDPRRHREGLYHAQMLTVGTRRVQVIGLDARWFRSPLKRTDRRDAPGRERYVPDADPTKTLLGPVQWRWLEERLATPAEVHVIVSGVQCVVEGHGWECWGNLPLELARLYRTIRQTGAHNVVILSGDRHIGAVYRHDGPEAGYPIWEMTSSGITHAWADAREAGPNRVGPLVTVRHFGLLDVDFAANRLTLSLRGEDGAALQTQAFNLTNRP